MRTVGRYYQYRAPGTFIHSLAPSGYLFRAGNNILEAGIRTYILKGIVHKMVTDRVIGKFREQLTAAVKWNLGSGPGG